MLVGTDPGGPETAAVRWAADEAVRRHAPLLVLPRRAVAGTGHADVALVVLDAAAPGIEDVVTGARCPTVAVPDVTGRDDADGRPVVLALGPTTGPEAIGFALREAELRGVGLRVVRTWDDPTVDLGHPQPAAIARWDAADDRRRREVTRHLAGPLRDHPDVPADVVVVHESCGGLLPAFAPGAALVVTGRPTSGPRSPALAVLRGRCCPVAVVPPEPRAVTP